jgi:hypothetical protein
MRNNRAVIGLGFYLLAFAGLFSLNVAKAEPVTISGGDTSPSNQRRIANTSNGFWVFASFNGDFAWSYSADGTAWTSPTAVFTSSPTAGDKGTIWWKNISGTDYVYAAVADGQSNDESVFIRRGTLNSGGTITWSDEARVNMHVTSNNYQLQVNAPLSITLAADNDVYIAGECKRNGVNTYGVCMNQCNVSLSSCGFTGGLTTTSGDADRWFPTLTPVDNFRAVIGGKDSDNTIFRGMLATDALPPTISANNSNVTFNAIRTADDARMTNISAETVRADFFWVDNNGALMYNRKFTTSVSSWMAASLTIDNSGTSAANYLKAPSVGLAPDYSANGKLVVVYGSTDATSTGGIHYATCWSTGPVSANDCPKTTYWSRTGVDPVAAAYATPPEPLPVVYTDGGDVTFDLIAVSTFATPRLTTMSVVSAGQQAGLTGPPYYQIRISGINFRTLNGKRPSVSFIDEITSATISNIAVSSVTFIGYQDVIANLSIAANTTGKRYSLRLTNPDGRVSNTLSSSFTVTAATITMLNPPSITYSSGIANIAKYDADIVYE